MALMKDSFLMNQTLVTFAKSSRLEKDALVASLIGIFMHDLIYAASYFANARVIHLILVFSVNPPIFYQSNFIQVLRCALVM